MDPDERSPSWRQWLEIRQYGAWLRHIGDFSNLFVVGDIPVMPWTKNERQRAKEISNRYFAHSEGAPGPNGTVKVAYRYKKKVEYFSLSPGEVSDLHRQVLRLVCKQFVMGLRVMCVVCGDSSDGPPIQYPHLDYSGIDTNTKALGFRPLATEVNVVMYVESDVAKGTGFTYSILFPTLSQSLDVTEMRSPKTTSVGADRARGDKDRIVMPLYAVDDTFVGPITEVGLWSEDVCSCTLMLTWRAFDMGNRMKTR